MSSCWSDGSSGETGVAWHWVGDDGSALIVSHVGAGFLRASSIMGAFQLPRWDVVVPIDMIGARGVDPSENIGHVERG